MSEFLGKNLLTSFLGTQRVSTAKGAEVSAAKKPAAFKTAGYASIPYEKAPAVKDFVPTKDANGKPFWADYVTPEKVWVA